MPPPNRSQEIFHRFADSGSPGEFRQLVEQHLPLVHSAAQRQLGTLAHQAEDVAQSVFTLLVRKAARLPRDLVLAAWLHRQAVRFSLNLLRSERRRQKREQEAAAMNTPDHSSTWQLLAPHLDEALASLPERERSVLVERYFEDRDAAEISVRLGISREAAQKRIERAVEGLRRRLARRTALPLTAALLTGALPGRTVQAAPAGMAGKVSTTALQNAAGGGTGFWAGLKLATAAAPAALLAALVSGAAAGWYSPDAAGRLFKTSTPAATPGPVARSLRDAPDQAKGESLIAALERLGHAPRNYRTELEFDALIRSQSPSNAPAICSEALRALSPLARERVMRRLMAWWFANDKAAALEFALDNGSDPSAGLASSPWKLYNDWLSADHAGAAAWLLARLARPEPFGGSGHGSSWSLAGQTIQHVARRDLAKMIEFYLALPAAIKRQTYDQLADDSSMERWRENWSSSQWRTLSAALERALAEGQVPEEALHRVVGRWSVAAPKDAREWAASLEEPSRFTAALGIAIAKPGFMDEGRSRRTHAEQLESLTKAVAGSADASTALTQIVKQWPLQDQSLVPWLEAQDAGPEADTAWIEAARRLAWPRSRSTINGKDPNPPPHLQALQAASHISEDTKRVPLENGLVRRWHQSDAAAAAAWLESSGWEPARITDLQSRLSQP